MLSNNPVPPVWTLEELRRDAQASLDAFVNRRLGESADRFPRHVQKRRRHPGRLFRLLSAFVAGPPISEDDLIVLVTRRPIRLSRQLVENEPELLDATLKLICSLADNTRFPWLKTRRRPRSSELKLAIRATAALHAFQRLQTKRRGYGKQVEARPADRLRSLGYDKARTPNKGRVTAPVHFPRPRQFYGECTV